jgi:hypothetical protein
VLACWCKDAEETLVTEVISPKLAARRRASVAGIVRRFGKSMMVAAELPEPNMLIVPKKPTRFRLRPC